MRVAHIFSGLLAAGCAAVDHSAQRELEIAPLVAYHQHLASGAIDALIPGIAYDADRLVQELDRAGIRRGVVLSVAYMFGDDRRQVDDEEAKVRAENDWTAAQIAHWPDRLVGFCGVNPLRHYSVAELNRCTRLPNMIGLKLHFGNSGVSLRNPDHLERIQAVFRAANSRRSPIIVHMRAREGTPFGREDAEIFLREVLPLAPDSVVQIAHLAGAGYYPDYADEAMRVFSDAIGANDRRTHHLYFDVTGIAGFGIAGEVMTSENRTLIAQRLRQVGLDRVLFGSDLPFGENPAPREAWEIFREKAPLTEAEFRDIADNIAPFMR